MHHNHCKSSILLSFLLLLLSHSPTPTTVLASPAAMAAAAPPPRHYGEAPPPPPPSSSSTGYDDASTAPSFALPASTPPQAYLSVTAPATPDTPYAPSSSTPAYSTASGLLYVGGGNAALPTAPSSSSTITDDGMAIGDALAFIELDANNSTVTTTPELPSTAVVTTPTTSTVPTASGGPGPGEVRDAAGVVIGSLAMTERPIFIALAPTVKPASPDMCPQNVCKDYANEKCGRRYGGCWDSCEEDRQYLDPGCDGITSSVKCRGC